MTGNQKVAIVLYHGSDIIAGDAKYSTAQFERISSPLVNMERFDQATRSFKKRTRGELEAIAGKYGANVVAKTAEGSFPGIKKDESYFIFFRANPSLLETILKTATQDVVTQPQDIVTQPQDIVAPSRSIMWGTYSFSPNSTPGKKFTVRLDNGQTMTATEPLGGIREYTWKEGKRNHRTKEEVEVYALEQHGENVAIVPSTARGPYRAHFTFYRIPS